jgi:hypothetical protein
MKIQGFNSGMETKFIMTLRLKDMHLKIFGGLE